MTNKKNESGKIFENLITESCDILGLDCTRLRDAGYRGEETERRFTVKNICDFLIFNGSCLLYLEAKVRKFSIKFDDLTQLESLLKKQGKERATGVNVQTGFLFNFSGRKFFMRAIDVQSLSESIGKKSMNVHDVEKHGVEILGFFPTPKSKKERININFIFTYLWGVSNELL